MASHLLPLTLSVTVVIDVRHAYIITLPALFINPSDYLTVTPVRGTPGFLHLVFDLRYCQIRYPPRLVSVIRGEL